MWFVPLRAVVGLSLSQPKYVFDPLSSQLKAGVNDTLELPGGNPASVAAAGGDPTAARNIASANSLESLRADATGGLVVSGSVSIGAAASFSTGATAGGSFGIAASAGASAGFSGLQLGADASASLGKDFNTAKILANGSATASASSLAFDVSGKASMNAGSSFKADVSGGVHFDEV